MSKLDEKSLGGLFGALLKKSGPKAKNQATLDSISLASLCLPGALSSLALSERTFLVGATAEAAKRAAKPRGRPKLPWVGSPLMEVGRPKAEKQGALKQASLFGSWGGFDASLKGKAEAPAGRGKVEAPVWGAKVETFPGTGRIPPLSSGRIEPFLGGGRIQPPSGGGRIETSPAGTDDIPQEREDPFSNGLKEYRRQGFGDQMKLNRPRPQNEESGAVVGGVNKSLFGGDGPSKRRPFVPPLKVDDKAKEKEKEKGKEKEKRPLTELEEWAKQEGLDLGLVESIQTEIIDSKPLTTWEDIAGLEEVKSVIDETIILPAQCPQLFTGLRKPARGILLFGPPGTGKTMVGRAIAGQLRCTFYSISASSLTSKWVGESERLIKTLFRLAVYTQPSVIFVDEIDSLLTARSEGEMEVARRIKTEFFVQLDGARTDEDDKILIIGTTNRPEQLDEAARRRFAKKLYVPLPNREAKRQLLKHEILKEIKLGFRFELSDSDFEAILDASAGFSCADMKNLLKETAMEPVRELVAKQLPRDAWNPQQLEPVSAIHFAKAFKKVKPSVSPAEIKRYIEWNAEFGAYEVTEPNDEPCVPMPFKV